VCVAHECAHLEYGRPHVTLKFSEEAKVRNAAARWLLPDLALIGETLATYDAHRAAQELWVTFPVLIDRLNDLTDAESYYVQSFREGTA
jgi:urocanate hydratase